MTTNVVSFWRGSKGWSTTFVSPVQNSVPINDSQENQKNPFPEQGGEHNLKLQQYCRSSYLQQYRSCLRSTTMEVKVSLDQLGVFATKAYTTGSVIWEEKEPLLILAPTSTSQETSLIAEIDTKSHSKRISSPTKNKEPSLWLSINVPPEVPESYHGTFKGMVQAALCWTVLYQDKQHDEAKEKFLKLYSPSVKEPSKGEATIVDVAKKALKYLTDHGVVAKTGNNDKLLLSVMFIWTCNSFEQGRVYETISRINHSCNPNAIVKADGDGQRIVAAAPIAVGDEISISYLGMLLWVERDVRREYLQQTKHFTCACNRCSDLTEPDLAAAVPCFQCHERTGRQLDEDTQYDDEQTVQYVSPQQQDDGAVVYSCTACNTRVLSSDEDYVKYVTAGQKVVVKVTKFLRDYDARQSRRESDEEGDDDDEDDSEEVQDEMLDQHIRMASSVLGAKHWTTNLLLLLQVDRSLQSLHGAMLTADPKSSSPDLDSIAATVDSLERIVRFVQGLGLKLHIGHLVGDVIVGLARALVALGDTQSQTYAAEWLDKISTEYVQRFASPGLQKVVQSLRSAWQQPNEKGRSKPPAKKAKR
eukprot:scaffold8028_cov165-Amphora_coffeaeformis.AAC.12